LVTTPLKEGILFQRLVKTGTTTMAGIVLRLAHSRGGGSKKDRRRHRCLHRANHGHAVDYRYGQQDVTKSFLFSVLRDPTSMAISRFFHFDVSMGQKDPTDVYFQEVMM